jgi:hypothetical protein
MTWRKARRSQATDSCVEVAGTLDRLRDSKNTAGPELRGNVTALIHAIKSADIIR